MSGLFSSGSLGRGDYISGNNTSTFSSTVMQPSRSQIKVTLGATPKTAVRSPLPRLAESMSQYLIHELDAAANIDVRTKAEMADCHGLSRLGP
jgi:hypothetical protein